MIVHNTAPSRRPSVVATDASAGLAELDVQELRAHRVLLGAEDDRVSYWTCLTRARIDGLEADEDGEAALNLAQLMRVLGDTGSGRRRTEISKRSGTRQLPTLPDVARTWAGDVDRHDHRSVEKSLADLVPAERQLIAYRSALHDLMDDSTRELILRYRDDPRAAIDALPAA